jgi:replicative DNA helicase
MNFNKPQLYDNLGKLPPQAIDLEKGVLGALLIENTPQTKAVKEILLAEYF